MDSNKNKNDMIFSDQVTLVAVLFIRNFSVFSSYKFIHGFETVIDNFLKGAAPAVEDKKNDIGSNEANAPL